MCSGISRVFNVINSGLLCCVHRLMSFVCLWTRLGPYFFFMYSSKRLSFLCAQGHKLWLSLVWSSGRQTPWLTGKWQPISIPSLFHSHRQRVRSMCLCAQGLNLHQWVSVFSSACVAYVILINWTSCVILFNGFYFRSSFFLLWVFTDSLYFFFFYTNIQIKRKDRYYLYNRLNVPLTQNKRNRGIKATFNKLKTVPFQHTYYKGDHSRGHYTLTQSPTLSPVFCHH